MPIIQTQSAFNIGRDCQIIVQHPLAPGGRLDIPVVTGFTAAQRVAEVVSDALSGVQGFAYLPKGWSGSFMADRASSGVDDLFALIEAVWYPPAAGTILPATLTQFITETNGATSTYVFNSVAMKFTEPGEWRGDAIVKQKVEFMAWRRIKQ